MKIFALTLLLLCAGMLYGQEENDPFKRLDDKFDELSEQQDQNFQDYINRQDAKYKAWVARIEAKWNSFEDSDKKTWVDYSDDLDGKNRVDYDNGTLSIQVIQPADDPDAQKKARLQALNQFQKLFTPNPATGQVPLKNQIAFDDNGGQPVSSQNAGSFFNQKLGGQFKPVGTFMSNDGIRRIKYRVDVPFVQNHVVRRAQEFLPLVVKNCERFRLNPRLVLALIYTESAFNPMAKSYADAYGLMQLIPRYAPAMPTVFCSTRTRWSSRSISTIRPTTSRWAAPICISCFIKSGISKMTRTNAAICRSVPTTGVRTMCARRSTNASTATGYPMTSSTRC